MNKPILYPANETAFTSNGLGRLSDAISCHVKETINSVYELEMVYPVKGIHFSDIQEHRYIYCPHDESGDPQPFEIYRISRPINGRVTVNASHISYKLNKMIVKPFTAEGLLDALQTAIPNNVLGGAMPFTFTSDKTSTTTMHIDTPVAIRSVMGGMQGSILDVYGGEWEYDHFSCMLRNRRGQDTGINIRYGKNLTDVNKTTDATNFWTGITPFWKGNDPSTNTETVVVYNGVIYSSVRNSYAYEMNIAVDASGAFDSPPSQSQLQAWGQSYVNSNAKSGVPLTIKISFVQLWQTDEYKDIAPLQRLRIGDSVTVHYEELGVDNTTRIVGYDYNVLAERYDSMTVGDVQATLVSSITKEIEDITKTLPSKSFFEAAIGRATELIKGGYGGYVVLNTNAAGQPNEILVMNTPDKSTATRVMRINYQGIAFGSSYNGPFNSAWTTLDGTFDAQYINVINLSASSINTGYLSASRIQGGTMKLGGSGNGNGKLEIYDAGDNKIGTLDNTGANLTGNIVMQANRFYTRVGQAYVYVFLSAFAGFGWANPYALNMFQKDANGKTTSLCVFVEGSSSFQESILTNQGAYYRAVTLASRNADLDTSTAVNYTKRYLESFDDDGYSLRYWDNTSPSDFDERINLKKDNVRFMSDDKTTYIDMEGEDGYEQLKFIAGDYGLDVSNYGVRYTVNGSSWTKLMNDTSSSLRYKHDIDILMDKELDSHKLYDLPVRQFMYNDDVILQYDDMRGQILPGFIAEEVAEIYPSAVIHNPVTGEIESWDERRIIPGMLALIQEQKKQIDVLMARIEKLEMLVLEESQ